MANVIKKINTGGTTYPIDRTFTVTGLSSVAGNGTSGSYLSVRWYNSGVEGLTAPYDGMRIMVKIPRVGVSGAGAMLSINGNNDADYHPLAYNNTSVLTSHYAANTYKLFVYDASASMTVYKTSNTSSTVTGVWKAESNYADGNSYQVRQYQAGRNVAGSGTQYPILTRYNLTNKNGSYDNAYSRFHTDVTVNTLTGYINAKGIGIHDTVNDEPAMISVESGTLKIYESGQASALNISWEGFNMSMSDGSNTYSYDLPTHNGTLALTNIDNNFSTSQTFKDITLYSSSGDSPRITFQRGTLTDTYNDWSMYDSGGYFYIQQRGSGSSSWETRATFTQNGVTFAGTVNGYTLAGASAKAVDTSISAGSTSTNLPTSAAVASFVEGKGYTSNTGTITGVSVNGTSIATSGVAALTDIAKTNVSNTFTAEQTFQGGINVGNSSTGDSGRIWLYDLTNDDYSNISSDDCIFIFEDMNGDFINFDIPNATIYSSARNKTYTLPTQSGTLALTSDIPTLYEHNIVLTLSQTTGTTGKLCCSFRFINNSSSAYTTHASLVTAMFNAGYNSSSHYIAASGEYSVPGTSQTSGYKYSVIGLYYSSSTSTYPVILAILTGTCTSGVWTINDNVSTYLGISVYGGTTPTIIDSVRAL